MSDLAKVKLNISGRVQGVFYRQSTRETARSLGLCGWVRNKDDGTVELEAVGARQQLERLIEWCRKGPPSARVDAVDIQWISTADNDLGASFEVVG